MSLHITVPTYSRVPSPESLPRFLPTARLRPIGSVGTLGTAPSELVVSWGTRVSGLGIWGSSLPRNRIRPAVLIGIWKSSLDTCFLNLLPSLILSPHGQQLQQTEPNPCRLCPGRWFVHVVSLLLPRTGSRDTGQDKQHQRPTARGTG